jgi:hypothetical protein
MNAVLPEQQIRLLSLPRFKRSKSTEIPDGELLGSLFLVEKADAENGGTVCSRCANLHDYIEADWRIFPLPSSSSHREKGLESDRGFKEDMGEAYNNEVKELVYGPWRGKPRMRKEFRILRTTHSESIFLSFFFLVQNVSIIERLSAQVLCLLHAYAFYPEKRR